MEKSQRTEITTLSGFMSGLMRTRAGLPFTDPRPDQDPFMTAYNQGEEVREQIVTAAVERLQPNYVSIEQLRRLVDASEVLLAGMEHGAFDSNRFADEVARARLHLARAEGRS